MATIVPSGGINETEDPTLIADDELQSMDGAEYRVGKKGLFQARGRKRIGQAYGIGWGIYEAGFDGTTSHVIAHTRNILPVGSGFVWHLSAAPYGRSMTVITDGGFGSGTKTLDILERSSEGVSAMVGTHYSNRHYLALGGVNRKLEYVSGGLTLSTIGMSRSTFAIGVSVTQAAGSMSAATGIVYWATEYDSTRGIESMTGASASTGVFTSLDSVIVTVTGVSANRRADQIRWYRSVDGGGFPDGGLIETTAIGTTQITDSQIATTTLTVPQYGVVSLAGLDTERDSPPPPMHTIFGPFKDSLLGVRPDDPRTLYFTPAGYPDSWPSAYGLPIQTHRRDEIVTGVILPGRIGVFCLDSAHVIYRLPRDSDSIFAAGEAQDVVTDARGCVSRKGACTFTPPGSAPVAAWVARDGICVSDLTVSPVIVTNKVDWIARVDAAHLYESVLVDDPLNQRLAFAFRRLHSDSSLANTLTETLQVARFGNGSLDPPAESWTKASDGGLHLATVGFTDGFGGPEPQTVSLSALRIIAGQNSETVVAESGAIYVDMSAFDDFTLSVWITHYGVPLDAGGATLLLYTTSDSGYSVTLSLPTEGTTAKVDIAKGDFSNFGPSAPSLTTWHPIVKIQIQMLDAGSGNSRLAFDNMYVTSAPTTEFSIDAANEGLWYLDYQEYQTRGFRITIADNGRISDAMAFEDTDGTRRLVSICSAQVVGQINLEGIQDADDSVVIDASGSTRFKARTKEFLPAGPRGTVTLGKATWMHDAGPAKVTHRFYANRRDDPEVKMLPDSDIRTASDVVLGKNVNSVSVELESAGTPSYGIHWLDIEGLDSGPLGGREGA